MFKKHQETLNGADWVWLFYDKNRCLEFRVIVQAKRLYSTGSYDAFKIEQPDKMLRYSQVVDAVPVYALYNYPRARGAIYPIQRPHWTSWVRGIDHARDYGVSLVHAKLVKALGQDGKDARKMLDRAFPWWLPFCNCGLIHIGGDPLQQIAMTFSEPFGVTEGYREPATLRQLSGATEQWLNGNPDAIYGLENEFLNPDIVRDTRQDEHGFRPSFIMATEVSEAE
ncbi:MAG: hypothetical protein GY761_20600 [Hyphomicrobiales bacterium]|nr:hypothetical protein [Hyphomicrobiales bacterium]